MSRGRRVLCATLLVLPAILAAAAGPAPAPPGGAAAAPSASPAPAQTTAQAGDVRLDVGIDRTSITIGDPIVLTLRLSYPPKSRIEAFTPESDLDRLALLGRSSPPARHLADGRVEETRTLRVTAYETGRLEIPSFSVSFTDASGKAGALKSEPIPFEVQSVLAASDSEPADIKPPATMPERALWPWVALGAAAVAALLYLWWRRRRVPGVAAPARPAEPARPPHEVAYEELERLLSSGLLEAGRVKEFHIELSEIARRYLSRRFGVETFERTSSEILDALRAIRVDPGGQRYATELFSGCDLVKFARHRPPAEETRATVQQAYHLVDATRPPAPAPPALAAGGAAPAASGAGG